jgi:hypothetical protein
MGEEEEGAGRGAAGGEGGGEGERETGGEGGGGLWRSGEERQSRVRDGVERRPLMRGLVGRALSESW